MNANKVLAHQQLNRQTDYQRNFHLEMENFHLREQAGVDRPENRSGFLLHLKSHKFHLGWHLAGHRHKTLIDLCRLKSRYRTFR